MLICSHVTVWWISSCVSCVASVVVNCFSMLWFSRTCLCSSASLLHRLRFPFVARVLTFLSLRLLDLFDHTVLLCGFSLLVLAIVFCSCLLGTCAVLTLVCCAFGLLCCAIPLSFRVQSLLLHAAFFLCSLIGFVPLSTSMHALQFFPSQVVTSPFVHLGQGPPR